MTSLRTIALYGYFALVAIVGGLIVTNAAFGLVARASQ